MTASRVMSDADDRFAVEAGRILRAQLDDPITDASRELAFALRSTDADDPDACRWLARAALARAAELD